MAQENILETDMAVMKNDMADVKVSIGKIAEALTRLAILEDRQSAHAVVMDKLISRLEAMETRQRETELTMAEWKASAKTAALGVKIFWAMFGGGIVAAIGFVATKLT